MKRVLSGWAMTVGVAVLCGVLSGACGSGEIPSGDRSDAGARPDGSEDGGSSGGRSADGGAGGSGGVGSGGRGGLTNDSGGAGAPGTGGTGVSREGGVDGAGPSCAGDDDCGSGAVCDVFRGRCVECLFDSNCPDDHRCSAQSCREITACNDSLDCRDDPNGQTICDEARDECVECVSDADCGDDARCRRFLCESVDSCENSLDCAEGLVCDAVQSFCVECASHADCGAERACLGNTCVAECQSDNQCTPMGKLCDHALGVCVSCQGDDECPDAYHCAAGTCQLDACEAGTSRCESGGVAHCSDNGDGYLAPEPCDARQTCLQLDERARCEPWVCGAGATECQGEVLVECSDDGLRKLSETDCVDQGKRCALGECRTCESAASDVRFVELYAAAPYVVIENTSSTCPADLDGLSFSAAEGTGSAPADFTFPDVTLQPGGQATLVQTANANNDGDITVTNLPDWTSSGYIMLCRGGCADAAGTGNVLDALSFGTAPRAFPSPIEMSPQPMEATSFAYLRTAFDGVTPTFLESDWSTGNPTRHDAECPASQPSSSSACPTDGMVCQYSSTTCTCAFFSSLDTWSCRQ